MVRVILPYPLQALARADAEVQVEVEHPPTVRSLIHALESRYPMLRGTIVDHNTDRRRPRLRFFACSADISRASLDTLLPGEVLSGKEPFLIIGAISGG
jgi:sulfur-carrier protein